VNNLATRRSRWWRAVAGEAASIGSGPAPRVPVAVALGVTAGTVTAGNAVVLLQRRLGGDTGELLTTVALPLLGASGSVALIAAGWRRRDVGMMLPSRRALGRLPRPARALAGVLGAAAIATLVRGGSHDGISDRLTIVRLVVGTALGEEMIHRGALFALWAATGRPTRTVVVANAVAFGAWHIVTVAHQGWLTRIAGIVVPALPGTALFLWGRCRSGTVLGSTLLHVGTNLPFVVARLWSDG
jgi:Type II CAAX prenyl endopeptidase Rce1-like